jgi:hypothetical protein
MMAKRQPDGMACMCGTITRMMATHLGATFPYLLASWPHEKGRTSVATITYPAPHAVAEDLTALHAGLEDVLSRYLLEHHREMVTSLRAGILSGRVTGGYYWTSRFQPTYGPCGCAGGHLIAGTWDVAAQGRDADTMATISSEAESASCALAEARGYLGDGQPIEHLIARVVAGDIPARSPALAVRLAVVDGWLADHPA